MATFGDLKTYVERDGWTEEPSLTRGRRRTGNHWRFSKWLPDGTLLRTKISHSLRDEIGADLFRHILRDQLRVREDAFWAVVRGASGEGTAVATPPATIPGWLVQRLLFTVGLGEDDLRSMSPEEALATWETYLAGPKP